MPARVTIKSIAKDLGISHMTVSRALSGSPKVQSETRDKIEKRARELGYVRSAAARAMRGDATQIVGLLLPNIVNEFYARFANAMALACEARGLHLIIHLTDDDSIQESRSLDRLREVQAMAVLMVPTPGADAVPSSDMKTIQLIRQDAEAELPAVLVDDHAAIGDGVMHLAATGHGSIGYIGGSETLSSGRERLAAYRAGVAQAGLLEDEALIQTDTPSFDMGRKLAGELIDAGRATALICGGVEMSNGALSAAMDRGLQPGHDIGFVGYGDPSFYAWISGGISTVRLPVDELAEAAIELLKPKVDDQTPCVSPKVAATFVARGAP